jgi:hypothetical protein
MIQVVSNMSRRFLHRTAGTQTATALTHTEHPSMRLDKYRRRNFKLPTKNPCLWQTLFHLGSNEHNETGRQIDSQSGLLIATERRRPFTRDDPLSRPFADTFIFFLPDVARKVKPYQ